MPRNQGTSRKGKPSKQDKAIGFGRTLQKATTSTSYVRPKPNGKSRSGDGGMQPSLPTTTGATLSQHRDLHTTKSVLELESVDDFLFQAELANAQFVSDRYGSAGAGTGGGVVVIDPTSSVYKPPVVKFQDDGANTASTSSTTSTPASTETFVFKELSVPRRPKWDSSTTPQQLEEREQRAFLEWRRSIARHEEVLLARQYQQQPQQPTSVSNRAPNISVTPFEKNLQVWRQLWRVLERSSCVMLLVDARNPLFYLSDDLRDYATRELQTPLMVVVNKSDYLSPQQRRAWHSYLTTKGWDGICFFSAFEEQRKLDQQAQMERRHELNEIHDGDNNESDDDDDDDLEEISDDEPDEEEEEPMNNEERTDDDDNLKEEGHDPNDNLCPPLLSRQQLIDAMLEFAALHNCPADPRYATMDRDDPNQQHERIPFGLVGFPNVGKSSVINVLMGNSKHTHGTVKVGVAAQPGKTKHFQTLYLPGETSRIVLCDCPGLVFPSFVSNTADLIASGVYPIAQMRDPYPVIHLICQRIPRSILNATYGIQLPEPSILSALHATTSSSVQHDPSSLPPPTAEELLDTYCHARSMLSASSGVPDVHRASRQIIHDYATGRLLYCHAPPPLSSPVGEDSDENRPFILSDDEYQQETLQTALRRTDKLRDKLLRQQEGSAPPSRPHDHLEILEGGGGDDDDDEDANDEDRADGAGYADEVSDDDEHLLDLLHIGDDASSSNGPSASSNKKHHKIGKKGKRGKKAADRARDADPYGCHDSPDDALVRQAAAAARSGGVGVKAGKYSRDAGYTRPSYAGARGAASSTASVPPATTTAAYS